MGLSADVAALEADVGMLSAENDHLTSIVASQATELVKARRALRTAIETCPCTGVACEHCRPLIAAAVQIGCW